MCHALHLFLHPCSHHTMRMSGMWCKQLCLPIFTILKSWKWEAPELRYILSIIRKCSLVVQWFSAGHRILVTGCSRFRFLCDRLFFLCVWHLLFIIITIFLICYLHLKAKLATFSWFGYYCFTYKIRFLCYCSFLL